MIFRLIVFEFEDRDAVVAGVCSGAVMPVFILRVFNIRVDVLAGFREIGAAHGLRANGVDIHALRHAYKIPAYDESFETTRSTAPRFCDLDVVEETFQLGVNQIDVFAAEYLGDEGAAGFQDLEREGEGGGDEGGLDVDIEVVEAGDVGGAVGEDEVDEGWGSWGCGVVGGGGGAAGRWVVRGWVLGCWVCGGWRR